MNSRHLISKRLITLALTTYCATLAVADNAANPSGEWVYNLGARTLFVVSLTAEKDGGQAFVGSFARPRQFQTNDSWSFSHIGGGIGLASIVRASWHSDVLWLVVQDSQDPAHTDTLLLKPVDKSHAQLQFEDWPLPPIDLVRAPSVPKVATDWEDSKTYSRDDGFSSNPEMERIFDDDQCDRQAGDKINWNVVGKADEQRRQAVMKLLRDGSLHTGEDFTWVVKNCVP